MLDVRQIRDNPEALRAAITFRGLDPTLADVDTWLGLDGKRRALQTEIDALNTEKKQIARLGKTDPDAARKKGQDILIVLHQMGNHGPAYYKRYPKEFELFSPVCATNQLEKCSKDEIINTYDNALRYTDFFLSRVISFLKKYDSSRETAMIYMSDHGESLGELGVYLHGLPYIAAPDAQKHIGAFIWLGKKIKDEVDIAQVRKKASGAVSHDNLFHTLLGLFEVKTKLYDKQKDLLPRRADITPAH